jgi:hypothetical protein
MKSKTVVDGTETALVPTVRNVDVIELEGWKLARIDESSERLIRDIDLAEKLGFERMKSPSLLVNGSLAMVGRKHLHARTTCPWILKLPRTLIRANGNGEAR